MGERIITADEARQLREGADPGPYSYSRDGIIWPTREDAADAVGCVSPRLVPEESHGTGALLASSWDLAVTVERLSALPAARMRAAWLAVADACDEAGQGQADGWSPEMVGMRIALAVRDAVPPGESVAEGIRAMCGADGDAPPPADVSLLALANRTLSAELEAARAEVARLTHIIAVERGDQTQAPAGWSRYGDAAWRIPGANGAVIQRACDGALDTWIRRGVLRDDPRCRIWPTALEAMEAIDAERGVPHA